MKTRPSRPTPWGFRLVLPLAAALLFTSCSGDATTPATPDDQPVTAAAAIDDGAHGGTDGFYFLPPLAPNPKVGDKNQMVFEPTVELCELDLGTMSCGALVTSVGPGDLTASADHFGAELHLGDLGVEALEPYRVQVFVDGQLMGYADIMAYDNGKQRKDIDEDDFVAVNASSTLPVNFRVTKGPYSLAGSYVTVDPAVIGVGDQALLTFWTADAAGNPVVKTGLTVQFTADGGSFALEGKGSLGPVTDNGDGTYTALFTADISGHVLDVSATVDGDPVTTPPATLTIFDGLSEAEALAFLENGYATYHRSISSGYPGMALSVAADDHSSSWGNWGMRDASQEPRQAFNNDPTYAYNNLVESPWELGYLALASMRDVILALDAGLQMGPGGADNTRSRAYARFVQGMTLGTLAQLFDRAFVLDEDTNLATVGLSSYDAVMAAALDRLDDAITLAGSSGFTLPAEWVGDQPMSSTDLAKLAHSHKARFMATVARTPSERAAVDWAGVLSEIGQGITADVTFDYDGTNQWWEYLESYGDRPVWSKADNRYVGPADQSGAYQAWLATPVASRLPFDIDTDDARVTQPGLPTTDGSLICYESSQSFIPARGTYHFSNYRDCRFDYFIPTLQGTYFQLKMEEMDLLAAEAYWRMGAVPAALGIINATRVGHGLLPAATAAGAPGARCVPRTDTGACGDLFEVLKWEKRLETHHYTMGTSFFDDRGWGDLVPGTYFHLPIPAKELDRLGIPRYTFGGAGPAMVAGAPVVDEIPGEGRNFGFKLLDGWTDLPVARRLELVKSGRTEGPDAHGPGAPMHN